MNSEPLIIAWVSPDLALLGPDGRLARRRLSADGDAASALAEIWTAEFPEDGAGILMTADAGPAALRRFCAAARQAGGRLVSACHWEVSDLSALSDLELTSRLISAAAGAPRQPNLLARQRWMPSLRSISRRRRTLALLAGAAVLFGSALWHVEAKARLSRRTAAAEAAHELEEAQIAAGLRRRASEQQNERDLRAVTPGCATAHELLLALSSAASSSLVVESVSLVGHTARVAYHSLPGGPRAEEASHFPSAVREALQSQGIESHFESESPAGASALEPAGPSFRLRLEPAAAASPSIAAAISRLPTAIALLGNHREWDRDWILADGPSATVIGGVSSLQLRFDAREKNRADWKRLLDLTAAIERIPGATIDQLTALGDGSETGAFGRVSLTATVLLRGG